MKRPPSMSADTRKVLKLPEKSGGRQERVCMLPSVVGTPYPLLRPSRARTNRFVFPIVIPAKVGIHNNMVIQGGFRHNADPGRESHRQLPDHVETSKQRPRRIPSDFAQVFVPFRNIAS